MSPRNEFMKNIRSNIVNLSIDIRVTGAMVIMIFCSINPNLIFTMSLLKLESPGSSVLENAWRF